MLFWRITSRGHKRVAKKDLDEDVVSVLESKMQDSIKFMEEAERMMESQTREVEQQRQKRAMAVQLHQQRHREAMIKRYQKRMKRYLTTPSYDMNLPGPGYFE